MAKTFAYEIKEHIAVLSHNGDYTRELTLTSFNGGTPKFDIRTWQQTPEGLKPLKGIALTDMEITALKAALNSRESIPDARSKKGFNPFRK